MIGDEECKCPPAGAPPWMATMADLMSLLLTFFVLLLSFANMDVVKFRMMLGSVKDAFGVQFEQQGDFEARSTSLIELSDSQSTPSLSPDRERAPQKPESPAPAMANQLSAAVARLDLDRLVEVSTDKRGVVVRVRGQLLFGSGATELRPGALLFLDEIARLARAFPYDLSIEGHTDDLPSRSSATPTNWHLSAHRAISVLRYLNEAGRVEVSRLSASGHGSTRPVVDNDSPSNRATNRRVEFVFLR